MKANLKDELELELMEAFTSTKSDQEIGMPDVEHELSQVMARRRGNGWPFRKVAVSVAIVVAVTGMAVAAVVKYAGMSHLFTGTKTTQMARASLGEVPVDLLIVPSDTIAVKPGMVRYDNAELVEIMTSLSNTYRKEVVFRKEELKHLHLHFQYSTEDKLEQVLQSLNMFEKITVKLNDGILEVN